jgi:phosphoglycolate phosphatase
MKRLVIFDLDGTLVDAYPAIYRSFNFVMRAFGAPQQSHPVIKRAVGWGPGILLESFIAPKDLKRAEALYRRHHAKALLTGCRWMPGARRLLRELQKRGTKVAIASNRPTRFVHIILRALGARKRFACVLCADRLPDGKKGKPDPAMLLSIIRSARVTRAQALFVGDMAIDVEAGRRARMDTLALATGSSTLAELKRERPLAVLKRVDEVLTYI